ncbi:hypothetical protein GCM10008959_20960 [Deinococcus seoulensis]|uniref:Uncharacterized protein n=1 Tax=Deinococcus seoulensis TaxID=1837379 RepID=A0ABQ2RRI1_9DEIO|nr:hypothetical protein GCM10008959_20960 [Deinococcus seoulensis]
MVQGQAQGVPQDVQAAAGAAQDPALLAVAAQEAEGVTHGISGGRDEEWASGACWTARRWAEVWERREADGEIVH